MVGEVAWGGGHVRKGSGDNCNNWWVLFLLRISLLFSVRICQYQFPVFCLFYGFETGNYVANCNSLSAAGTTATFVVSFSDINILIFDISSCLFELDFSTRQIRFPQSLWKYLLRTPQVRIKLALPNFQSQCQAFVQHHCCSRTGILTTFAVSNCTYSHKMSLFANVLLLTFDYPILNS